MKNAPIREEDQMMDQLRELFVGLIFSDVSREDDQSGTLASIWILSSFSPFQIHIGNLRS